MDVTIHATSDNKKFILDLAEEQGITLPCNCHGSNACGNKQYNFPCNLIPHDDITITIPARESFSGISLETKPDKTKLPDTLLIDLGSTTVAMVFYNSTSKTIFHSEVFPNPQRAYGTDIISRIKYDVEFHDDYTLKTLICDEIFKRCHAILHTDKTISIQKCLIGGNTTMIHLLLGFPLDEMAGSPFTPYSSANLHSKLNFYSNDTEVHILPWLSAFIGGDIVAGILSLNLDKRSDTCVLADLGTNGELVLLHKNVLYTASTAVGPAFEGGGLSYGCPAIPGAISDVSLNHRIPTLQTIANKLPTGICGSGAVSILSELITYGYLDASGIVTDKFPPDGLLISRTPSSKHITFTTEDIRQMQLAVAAIGAGIDTLCHHAGIQPEDVDHLYLAGGLGYNIHIEKASVTGLFSYIQASRIHTVGNSCLKGLANMSSNTTPAYTERINRLGTICQEIVLADDDFFQKQFIQHMTYETISTL